jgi:hypothetical protein
MCRTRVLPHPDASAHLSEYAGKAFEEIPSGPFPQGGIDETVEDLNDLSDAVTDLGVIVKPPETWPHSREKLLRIPQLVRIRRPA